MSNTTTFHESYHPQLERQNWEGRTKMKMTENLMDDCFATRWTTSVFKKNGDFFRCLLGPHRLGRCTKVSKNFNGKSLRAR